jgi:DNA polymerase-3 subunit delta
MLYLVLGKNEFLRDEFIGQLKALMYRLPAGEHNLDEFGPAAPVRDVIATCDSMPFLSEKRMVIVRGACSASGRGRSRARASAATTRVGSDDGGRTSAEALAAYVSRLPESTHLVLVEDDPAAVKPIQAAKPDAVRREFPPLREDAVPGWVVERAKKHQVRIAPQAARELVQLAGTDLRILDIELEKLATYIDPGAVIESREVRTLVAGTAPSIFEFQDALAERRPAAALEATRARLNYGDDPAELLAQAAGVVRRLLVVKELRARGEPLGRHAPTYGLSASPYLLQKLERQAAKVSASDLERAYLTLHDADLAIKTGRRDPDLAIELAIADIVGLGPASEEG